MNSMRATVVIRTTGRPSLAASLASVVLQRREDVEVVIVDALGSLSPLGNFGLPARWISHGHRLHRSVAAQAGLDAVTTRWALFLDDDDLLLGTHLARLMAALEAAPEAVAAHAGVELVGAGPDAERRGVFDAPFEPWELLLGNRLPIHAVMFDAQRARDAGVRFDPALDIYEDWDFWLQLRCVGGFVHVPGVSAQYIVGDDSSDAHRTAYASEAYWRVWRRWWGRAPESWWSRVLESAHGADAMAQQLRAARASLDAHVIEVAKLMGVAAERLDLIGDLREQLGAAIHQAAELQGSLRWTQDQLDSTRAELHATRTELAQRTHELDATGRVLAAAQIEQRRTAEQLQGLMHSTSWRITRPLRAAVDAARTARGLAGRWRREVGSRQSLVRDNAFRGYQRWIRGPEQRERVQRAAILQQAVEGGPTLSVVMPVYEPDLRWLDAAIGSVLAQQHVSWELCIADDASVRTPVREHLAAWAARDARIRVMHRDANGGIAACTNTAASLATGEWLVFLDQDDLLAPQALAEVTCAAIMQPDAGWIYTDEDKLDSGGHRFEPHRKGPFNLALLRGQNCVSHLSAIRRSLYAELGGLRAGYDGAQDHDLVLRAAERLRAAQVVHVPRVLYHWRAGPGSTAAAAAHKPRALDASLRAVVDHLQRCGSRAQPEVLPGLPWLRVRYALPHAQALAAFAESPSDVAWAERLAASTSGCRLQRQDDGSAPWLLRLGSGLWPTTPGWLEELAAQLAQPGVGVVAGAVHVQGRLADGAYASDAGAAPRTMAAGVPTGSPGPFGIAMLARDADAVTPRAMLMRRELWPLWQQAAGVDPVASALAFGAAVRAAGWRVVWTPHASLEAPGP